MSIRSLSIGIAGLAACTSALADGTHFSVPRNTVVPVVFQDELNIRENRAGDRFWVAVRDDREFPRGTKFEGRIIDVRQRRDDRPGYMDLEFTRIILPDGSKSRVRAVPIKLDLKTVSRSRDGRYTANNRSVDGDKAVIGGMVGGAVLGSLIKKPFEGAFVGALAGIIVAESNRNKNSDVVIRRGDVMGALLEQDVNLNARDSYGRYDDRRREYRDDLRISFKDRELRYPDDQRPYRLDEVVMVPLERTADQMGLNVDRLSGRTVLLESDQSMLKLELDSRDYRLNGRRGSLPRNVVNKDGIIYVPLEALMLMDLGRIYVDGTNNDN